MILKIRDFFLFHKWNPSAGLIQWFNNMKGLDPVYLPALLSLLWDRCVHNNKILFTPRHVFHVPGEKNKERGIQHPE